MKEEKAVSWHVVEPEKIVITTYLFTKHVPVVVFPKEKLIAIACIDGISIATWMNSDF